MKIIVSHDVDHLTVFEHLSDLIIPKFLIRGFIELGLGYITLQEMYLRVKEILKNRWNHIEELLEFDKSNGVNSTFFFGVEKGRGLAYSKNLAAEYIKLVLDKGFDVGVHGIAYNNFKEMKKEYEIFKKLSGLDSFGIRMHYLKLAKNTLNDLEKIGYLYDSTLYKNTNPYKIGNIWEFPLHIMDGYIILGKNRWQSINLKKAMDLTKKIIEQLFNENIRYLTILFHDRYFSDAFYTWKEWYINTILFLKKNGFSFVNYRQAIKELENEGI